VFDGADAVMLSAESASGSFPREAVAMMDRIVSRVEGDPTYREIVEATRLLPERSSADAIVAAARQVAHTIGAEAIATFTMSGSTALRISRERPIAPILGLTPREETARRLCVVWGVYPIVTADAHSMSEAVAKSLRIAAQESFAGTGEEIVVVAGMPFGTSGTTNALRIATMP
jgi:pyruvate kinase